MPRETICVYCEKPLLDAEHAKKHVLEQCPKAPWRGRFAELEATNTRLDKLLAKCATDYVDLKEANTRLRDEVEQAKRMREEASAAFEIEWTFRRAAEALNTPLREARDALRDLLSEGMVAIATAKAWFADEADAGVAGSDAWRMRNRLDVVLRQVREGLAKYPPGDRTTSDKPPIRQLDGRCTAWTRGGGERCLNAAAPGKSLCAEPHQFGEPDPELDELLDEIGSGLGCTPYLDGGAIRKAEEALSKLRARLTPAGGPEQDRGAAALRPAAEGIYPPGWPKCACGDYCMDGKATCGRVECL